MHKYKSNQNGNYKLTFSYRIVHQDITEPGTPKLNKTTVGCIYGQKIAGQKLTGQKKPHL